MIGTKIQTKMRVFFVVFFLPTHGNVVVFFCHLQEVVRWNHTLLGGKGPGI